MRVQIQEKLMNNNLITRGLEIAKTILTEEQQKQQAKLREHLYEVKFGKYRVNARRKRNIEREIGIVSAEKTEIDSKKSDYSCD